MYCHKPTTSEVLFPPGQDDLRDGAVGARSRLPDQSEGHSSDYDAGAPGAAGTATLDLSRRVETAAATEIGDPHGRIPSPQQTRDQLAAARTSRLPVGASRSAETHPPTSPTLSSAAREHRKSNYAPGYEKAFDAVPQRSYNAVGHEPTFLPHEKLESGRSGQQAADHSPPPPAPPAALGSPDLPGCTTLAF